MIKQDYCNSKISGVELISVFGSSAGDINRKKVREEEREKVKEGCSRECEGVRRCEREGASANEK